ncbi:glycosyltransferase [Lacihabitans lacunae]|uniref:Glycosyltransferase n=1 Tax=Lacihabitans lacunae TaxID=1028214 RepID=A0ABV7YS90_9BACT
MKLKNLQFIYDSDSYSRLEDFVINSVRDKYERTQFFNKGYEDNLIIRFHKWKYFGNQASHVWLWLKSLNSAIEIWFKGNNRTEIICINPIIGIFLGMINKLNRNRRRIIVCGFLFEPKSNQVYYKLRKLFVNFSFGHVDKIVVYSSSEILYYSEEFPYLKNKFTFILFGKDFLQYNTREMLKKNPLKGYIGSGGASNRDYDFLFRLINSFPSLKFKIATRPYIIGNKYIPINVEIDYAVTPTHFGRFIQESKFFILPLSNSKVSSGHMVLLECMANGIPVLVSNVPGIKDYLEDEIVIKLDTENITNTEYVVNKMNLDVENSEFRYKLEFQCKNVYQDKYTTKKFVERILLHL